MMNVKVSLNLSTPPKFLSILLRYTKSDVYGAFSLESIITKLFSKLKPTFYDKNIQLLQLILFFSYTSIYIYNIFVLLYFNWETRLGFNNIL